MDFPTLDEITALPRVVSVFYDNVYLYNISNESQLNNIRIWATYHKLTPLVRFVFNGDDIFITEKGDLTHWPLEMFDTTIQQLATLIRIKRGELLSPPPFFY